MFSRVRHVKVSVLCLAFALPFRWLCRCLGAFRSALIAFQLVLFGVFVLFSKRFIASFKALLRRPLRARSERAARVLGAGSVRACVLPAFPGQPSRRVFAPFPPPAFPCLPCFSPLSPLPPAGQPGKKFLSYRLAFQLVAYILEKTCQKSR